MKQAPAALWLSILTAMILFISGCTQIGEDTAEDSVTRPGGGPVMEEFSDAGDMEMGRMEDGDSEGGRLIGEKVIRNVSLDYETLDFTETTQYIRQTVARQGAFIEHSYETSYTPSGQTSRSYRMIDYTLRVPTDQLDAFLTELEGVQAQKISEQRGTEDVTQFYRDTEARVRVLTSKEGRLTELLEQADTIEEIIQIESSLSETIAERESLQSQLDYYDDLIDYTVVRLTVTERARLTGERGDQVSFLRRLQEALADSFFAFYFIMQDLFIGLIYALPYLIIAGIIGALIFIVRRRIRR